MISIIIPIYNTSKYLDQCLQSVLNQTYGNWECILVNDGSTDGCAEKCQEWEKMDTRFKVLHQLNQGVSVARNNALSIARGEWITFVDSDDWIDADYLEIMASNSNNADIVVSGQMREYANNSIVLHMPNATETFCINSCNSTKFNYINEKGLFYAPHEKLFRKDIILKNKVQFEIGCSYGEDLQFVYDYLNLSKIVSTVNKAMYHYRMGNGETLSTKFRANQFSEDYKQWHIVYRYYEKTDMLNKESHKYLSRRLWGIVYDGIFLWPRIDGATIDYLHRILSIPEIQYLSEYKQHFHCAKWIKWAILHRKAVIFWVVLMLLKLLTSYKTSHT